MLYAIVLLFYIKPLKGVFMPINSTAPPLPPVVEPLMEIVSQNIASAIVRHLRWGALNPPPAPLPPLTDPAIPYSYEALEVQIARYAAAFGAQATHRYIYESIGMLLVYQASEAKCRKLHADFLSFSPRTLAALREIAMRRRQRTKIFGDARAKKRAIAAQTTQTTERA